MLGGRQEERVNVMYYSKYEPEGRTDWICYILLLARLVIYCFLLSMFLEQRSSSTIGEYVDKPPK